MKIDSYADTGSFVAVDLVNAPGLDLEALQVVLAVVHGDRGALDPLGQAAAEVVGGAELHQLVRYVAGVTVAPGVAPDSGEDVEVVGGGGAEVDGPTVERLE
ncbi:MAG: hypothetical protein ABW009_12930 [Acidimicrobiales bacterium]